MRRFSVILGVACVAGLCGVWATKATAQERLKAKIVQPPPKPGTTTPNVAKPGIDKFATKMPDLVVTNFEVTGPAKYEGIYLHIPVTATVANVGAASMKGCSIAARYVEPPAFNPPTSKFTSLGLLMTPAGSQATVQALNPNQSVLILGYVSITDSTKRLDGKTLHLRLFVDPASSEFPQPGNFVKESNEDNNWSKAAKVKI